MINKWETAIAFVLAYEGGYVNNPLDPGGETKYGISKRSYPELDIAALTIDQAKDIYKRDYWTPCHCDELPDEMAIAVLDCAVNQGQGTARRLLQIALGVTVDGEIGPMTIAAAFKQGTKGTILFLMERAKLYMQTKNASIFGASWGERLILFTRQYIEIQEVA